MRTPFMWPLIAPLYQYTLLVCCHVVVGPPLPQVSPPAVLPLRNRALLTLFETLGHGLFDGLVRFHEVVLARVRLLECLYPDPHSPRFQVQVLHI